MKIAAACAACKPRFSPVFMGGDTCGGLTAWFFSPNSASRRVGNVPEIPIPMKKDLHPKYNPVVFVDMTTGKRFVSRSTKTSEKKEVIDGVEHSIISIGITSDSHPFFTGLAQFVDTEGRIDKFQKRFGAVRRVGKPKLD
jgi:large subunit ribosomal protein L31